MFPRAQANDRISEGCHRATRCIPTNKLPRILAGDIPRRHERVVGFEGKLVFDTTKPDGTPRKLMNVDRLKSLGWQYSIDLDTGLKKTYDWFLKNVEGLRQA